MKKITLAIIISLFVGFGIAYLVFEQAGAPMTASNSGSTSMEASNMSSESMHKEVEVDPELPIPAVEVVATPDSKDGYNLKINVTNFTFTPEKVGMTNEFNTGHAHIYINDEKLGRVYGEWFYLPSKYLKNGDNTVQITLNGNDHSDWLVDGKHVESTVTVTKS